MARRRGAAGLARVLLPLRGSSGDEEEARLATNRSHGTEPRRLGIVSLLLAALWSGCTQLNKFAYEGIGRDAWQQPDRVVADLQLGPGDRVADLGSGAGYFTFHLARAVGPTGHVYAVDLDEGLNQYVASRARDEGLGNVSEILARPDDPLLPPDGVDLIFTSNTYHHIDDRVAYFARARRYLRPGGRVAIIELAGKGWFDSWFGHWTSSETIRREMEAAGYRLQSEPNHLDRQFFLIFEVAADASDAH
jgi:arsenite methyltransferase